MGDVNMPRLSDSMEEGTILRWMKASGDEVKRGEEIAEIETDKATMAYEADADGTFEIIAEEGATLPVGELIARIGGGSGDAQPTASADSQPAEAPEPSEAPAAPAATASAETDGEAVEAAADTAADRAPQPADSSNGAAPSAAPTPAGERVKASPIARRLANEKGVDLHAVSGTGPGGRVVKADIESAQPGQAAPAAPAAVPAAEASAPAVTQSGAQGTAKGDVTLQELSRLQSVVARRMAESKATVPEFAITTRIDMDRCVELRSQLKELQLDATPSYNDMVVRACAVALREYPRANGSYNRDGQFELYSRINVGIAVAADDSLVVPTIFDADLKSLDVIAKDAKALAGRVRSGEITPPELSGGTFTVSNLGMFGVTEFTAVINSPQAAILAVGKMEPTPVVRDGEIVIRNIMAVTLTSDHRILYGADAAQFLARVKTLLEAPAALML
ncbi:MAG TPA: dihydrolipoamide acetyltransferase family protein [Baekduia sp.]|nr:dihydrolipoamide acetyltransferase family protein [Baekduia sp.]